MPTSILKLKKFRNYTIFSSMFSACNFIPGVICIPNWILYNLFYFFHCSCICSLNPFPLFSTSCY